MSDRSDRGEKPAAKQRMRRDKAAAPTLEAQLAFASSSGLSASARRIALLEQIAETGSITAAAKAVDLSYKAAWDAVAAMNNLADAPLVERTTGGKGGGGTRLTARGAQLVASFRAMEAEHRRFLAALNDQVARVGDDLRLLRSMLMQTSARNQFAGRVARLTRGAVNDEVELQLSGGDHLTAIVTHESSASLGLVEGREVIALVKASSVLVAIDDGAALKLSARNQLRGRVVKCTAGAVNDEVVIALQGGNTIAAIITHDSAQRLALAEGTAAIAVFKASSVIVGVPA